MDVAKIACVSIPARRNKYKIDDLLLQNELLRNLNAIECIQITTTAGTGSECTPFATIWDYENQEKKSLSHPKMFAKKAFIDPDFLINMPLNIALSTGLDSLNQAFESIWNRNSTTETIEFAIRSACLSLKNLPLVDQINDNEIVRDELAEASFCAGLAISHTRTSICHSISYALTLKFGIPHGLACAFSMQEVLNFNYIKVQDEISEIESRINSSCKDSIENIMSKYELDNIFKSYIGSKKMVLDISDNMNTKGRFDNNIIECSADDLASILSNSCKNFGIY